MMQVVHCNEKISLSKKLSPIVHISPDSKFYLSKNASSQDYLNYFYSNYSRLKLHKIKENAIISCCYLRERYHQCPGFVLQYVLCIRGSRMRNPTLFAPVKWIDDKSFFAFQYPYQKKTGKSLAALFFEIRQKYQERRDMEMNCQFEIISMYALLMKRWNEDVLFRQALLNFKFFFSRDVCNVYGWLLTLLHWCQGRYPPKNAVSILFTYYIMLKEGCIELDILSGLEFVCKALLVRTKMVPARKARKAVFPAKKKSSDDATSWSSTKMDPGPAKTNPSLMQRRNGQWSSDDASCVWRKARKAIFPKKKKSNVDATIWSSTEMDPCPAKTHGQWSSDDATVWRRPKTLYKESEKRSSLPGCFTLWKNWRRAAKNHQSTKTKEERRGWVFPRWQKISGSGSF